jgi:hypothetical protein
MKKFIYTQLIKYYAKKAYKYNNLYTVLKTSGHGTAFVGKAMSMLVEER